MKIKAVIIATSIFSSFAAESALAKSPCGRAEGKQPKYDTWAAWIWRCNINERRDMLRRFDMDRVNWNEGFGYHNQCDDRLPLKRTFNALQLLKYAGTDRPHCNAKSGWGEILTWAYCWAGHHTDELDAWCGKKGGPYARSISGFLRDDRIELFSPFFDELGVVERASTLLHEARHASDKCGHVRCRDGSSGCDKSYFQGCGAMGFGSYAMEVHWLAHYVWKGQRRWKNHLTRARAISIANRILSHSFLVEPGFRIHRTTAQVVVVGHE